MITRVQMKFNGVVVAESIQVPKPVLDARIDDFMTRLEELIPAAPPATFQSEKP